jgi:hypothetical protein
MTSFPFLPLFPYPSPLSSPPSRDINKALPNCRCALEIYPRKKAVRTRVGREEGGGRDWWNESWAFRHPLNDSPVKDRHLNQITQVIRYLSWYLNNFMLHSAWRDGCWIGTLRAERWMHLCGLCGFFNKIKRNNESSGTSSNKAGVIERLSENEKEWNLDFPPRVRESVQIGSSIIRLFGKQQEFSREAIVRAIVLSRGINDKWTYSFSVFGLRCAHQGSVNFLQVSWIYNSARGTNGNSHNKIIGLMECGEHACRITWSFATDHRHWKFTIVLAERIFIHLLTRMG